MSARIVIWFLTCWLPSIVLTTGPTDRQVAKIVWGEIHAAVEASKMKFGGKLLDKEWQFAKRHYALGFTTRDQSGSSKRFEGFHQDNVLVLLTEAAGIPPTIWESIEGVTTGEHVRMLAISQPAGDAGAFYDAMNKGCRKGPTCKCSKWHVIEISSWEAAAANEQMNIKGLASRRWCQGRLETWGEDSPLYQARVLGRVPAMQKDRIVGLAWCYESVQLDLTDNGICAIGVDVGGDSETSDETVITTVRGKRQTRQRIHPGLDTLQVAGRVLQAVREEREIGPVHIVNIDKGGLGKGPYDTLLDRSEALGLNVIGTDFGENAINEEEYADAGSEMWWEMGQDLKKGNLQLINDETLFHQLTTRKWDTEKQGKGFGRIMIESKKLMAKRGIKSPDRPDALGLARRGQKMAETLDIVGISISGDDEDDPTDDVAWHELG